MSECAACCFLGDYDDDVIENMLKSENDVADYLSMIGSDGWCVHLDKLSKRCSMYGSRPRFCRVELDVFRDLYDVQTEEELNEFAIACCEDHISNVYPALDLNDGEDSAQLKRFKAGIAS